MQVFLGSCEEMYIYSKAGVSYLVHRRLTHILCLVVLLSSLHYKPERRIEDKACCGGPPIDVSVGCTPPKKVVCTERVCCSLSLPVCNDESLSVQLSCLMQNLTFYMADGILLAVTSQAASKAEGAFSFLRQSCCVVLP